MSALAPNLDHCATFIERFRPDGCTTFVGIVPDGSTVAETFNGADQGEAAAWVAAQNRARGIYFTVNPTAAGLRKKPTKADITAIAAVWADIDPRDDQGVAWDTERDRLIALAAELHGLAVPPTFIVDSGNGIQTVWLLADPIEANDEYRQAAESLCSQIESALGAKGTHNVDRLLRVPGTRNLPNAKKRALGRGETLAALLRWTWRRYSWTELEQLAEHLRCSPPRHAVPCQSVKQRASLGALALPDDAPEPLEPDRLAALRSDHPDIFDLDRYDGDQSRQDLALALLARRLGWSHHDAWRLLIAVRGDQKAYRRDYIERTLGRAYTEQTVEPAAATSNGWPEPIPLFAEHEKPEPYPIDALPPIMRAAVETYQAFGQQPIELVACSALSTASLACQALADVDRDGNLTGPCSLSLITVAVSGERKTAADKRMRRELVAWQDEKRKEQAPAIKAAERRLSIWEARRDGMMAKIKRLSGSAKLEDEADRRALEEELVTFDLERPRVPPITKLFYEDVTPERLASSLSEGWPSSSLWSDEGGLVIGSHAMSEDVALRFLALLNRLWDGNPFDRDRETRSCAYVHGRRFTASLMLQPAALAKLVASGGGIARAIGALARYLIAWPTSTMGTRFYKPGDMGHPDLHAFDARLRSLLDLPLPLDDGGALDPPVVRLSRGAVEIWKQLHDDVERELGSRGEFSDLPDFGAKIAEQGARIACVLHIFDHGPTGEIRKNAMMSGAKIAFWHLHEARRVLGMIGHAGEAADAQALLEWLQERTEPTTLRDVQRGLHRMHDKQRRDLAVAKLLDHGLARVEKHGQSEIIAINPALRP